MPGEKWADALRPPTRPGEGAGFYSEAKRGRYHLFMACSLLPNAILTFFLLGEFSVRDSEWQRSCHHYPVCVILPSDSSISGCDECVSICPAFTPLPRPMG